jgi:hypothetical protein
VVPQIGAKVGHRWPHGWIEQLGELLHGILRDVEYRTEYAAAWVPEEFDGLDRRQNAALAVTWIKEQEARLRQRGHLFVPRKGDFEQWRDDRPAIDQWVKGNGRTVTSPRSGGPGSTGPVLVCYPTMDMVADASGRSAKSAVCILEWGVHMGMYGNDGNKTERDILTGWAKEARAENLLTGEVTPDDRPLELVKALQHILWIGNNGWRDKTAREIVTTRLRSLQAAGVPFTRGDILGYAAAHGRRWESIKQLAALVDKV